MSKWLSMSMRQRRPYSSILKVVQLILMNTYRMSAYVEQKLLHEGRLFDMITLQQIVYFQSSEAKKSDIITV